MFTLGNVSALAATCFLVGPKKQLENMSQTDRWASALTFTVAMIGTLVASIHVRSATNLLHSVMYVAFSLSLACYLHRYLHHTDQRHMYCVTEPQTALSNAPLLEL